MVNRINPDWGIPGKTHILWRLVVVTCIEYTTFPGVMLGNQPWLRKVDTAKYRKFLTIRAVPLPCNCNYAVKP